MGRGREGEREERREGGVGVEWRKGGEWYLCDCHSLFGSEKPKKILQKWILALFGWFWPNLNPYNIFNSPCSARKCASFSAESWQNWAIKTESLGHHRISLNWLLLGWGWTFPWGCWRVGPPVCHFTNTPVLSAVQHSCNNARILHEVLAKLLSNFSGYMIFSHNIILIANV